MSVIGAIWRRLPLPWDPDSFFYALRSIAAAALALGLGMLLQLDSPFSAASTVLLLVNPVQGAVVGKGLHRALGTLVGMIAAFVLMSLFAQKMLFFILGVGLWLGVCVAAMSVLKHYFATAAVVAGYTVCLALGPAIAEPSISFEHIMTRVSAVILGVFSLSLVTVLFSRKTLEEKVLANVIHLMLRAMRVVALHIAGDEWGETKELRTSLAIDIGKLDDIIGVARGESWRVSSNIAAIRSGLAYLLSAIIDSPRSSDKNSEAMIALAAIASRLARGSQSLSRQSGDFSKIKDLLDELRVDLGRTGLTVMSRTNVTHEHALLAERIDERLRDLASAWENFGGLVGIEIPNPRTVGFHRNVPDALRNGIRALVACLMAGVVWYLSAWDQGPTLLAVLCPYCTLLAATAMPTQGTGNFIRGTVYAIPAAACCKFLILPQINGYPLLIIALACFWSFGIHATTKAGHAFQGIAYLIAFNTLVGTGLQANYDFLTFANESVAWIIALCISLLAFQIIPKPKHGHALSVKEVLHKQTLLLLKRGGWDRHDLWEAKQQHRVISLESTSGSRASYIGYLSLQLGRELSRLQRRMAAFDDRSPIAEHAKIGLRRIARSRNNLEVCAAQARRTANSLNRLGAKNISLIYEDLGRLLVIYAQELKGC